MIEYKTSDWLWKHSCRMRGSVVPLAFFSALPSSFLAFFLVVLRQRSDSFRTHMELPVFQSTAWAVLAMPLTLLIAFRTRQALGRFWEGNGLLHAMRGEWFDSASCLVTFTFPAKSKKPREVREFRHTLVRLMSLCHGSALDEIKSSQSESYEVLDLSGLCNETMEILRGCKDQHFNRVEVILHMIQVLVIRAFEEGVIDVPAPILSRVYQTLSRGFVNLLNARKLKDTQFPFPYTQIISIFLLTFALLTPWVIATIIDSKIWCPIFTFMPIFALFSLNYIAGHLEMPFGDDIHHLPLSNFQSEMNASLKMFIHENSDHIPRTKQTCRRSFSSLRGPPPLALGGSHFHRSHKKRISIFSADYIAEDPREDDSSDSGDESIPSSSLGPSQPLRSVARGTVVNTMVNCSSLMNGGGISSLHSEDMGTEGSLRRVRFEDEPPLPPPSTPATTPAMSPHDSRASPTSSLRRSHSCSSKGSVMSHGSRCPSIEEEPYCYEWEEDEKKRRNDRNPPWTSADSQQERRQQQRLPVVADHREVLPVPELHELRLEGRSEEEQEAAIPFTRRLMLPLMTLLQLPTTDVAEEPASTMAPSTLGPARAPVKEGSLWC